MKRILLFILFAVIVLLVALKFKPIKAQAKMVIASVKRSDHINKERLTITSRVSTPEGYERPKYPKGSFQEYLRNYKLKAFGSKIINYDATDYFWQGGHIGILEIPVPKNGLQQCADALIRIRSEYLWENNRKNEIGFNFTSGDYCSWTDYAEGYRPSIVGNKVSFVKTASKNTSKDNFYKYLNLIYTYAGTLSLYNELDSIDDMADLKIGDMLIKGGSPGHIAMICDEAINLTGDKIYLLVQGNTPAQSVHLVKNLQDAVLSPWYQLTKNAVIPVSNYTFQDSKFVRFK